MGSKLSSTDSRWGHVVCVADDLYQSRSMLLYGEYSPGEARLFRRLLREGDVVVEGGANQGFLTLPLASYVGRTGRVLAFEPQPQFCEILRQNTAGLEQVEVYQKALSNTAGSNAIRSIEQIDEQADHRSYGMVFLGYGEYPVEEVAIDSFYLTQLNLIKADIEGYEEKLLDGAQWSIRRHRPVIYLENDKTYQCMSLIEKMKSLDYNCYWHLPFFYDPDNYFKNQNNLFAGECSRNMLCLPRESTRDVVDLIKI